MPPTCRGAHFPRTRREPPCCKGCGARRRVRKGAGPSGKENRQSREKGGTPSRRGRGVRAGRTSEDGDGEEPRFGKNRGWSGRARRGSGWPNWRESGEERVGHSKLRPPHMPTAAPRLTGFISNIGSRHLGNATHFRSHSPLPRMWREGEEKTSASAAILSRSGTAFVLPFRFWALGGRCLTIWGESLPTVLRTKNKINSVVNLKANLLNFRVSL